MLLQNEVSQKEKDKYCILMHIYGIQKDGTEEFICRAAMEKQTQRTDLWTWGEGETYGESNMETYITIYMIENFCLREFKQALFINLEGWDGEVYGRDVQEGRDICIPMADSSLGFIENNEIL